MRSFIDLDARIGLVPAAVVTHLSRADTGRGREDLTRGRAPALLTELAARARIESITASSALEGIVVPDAARAIQIIGGRATVLRNRSEQEFAGYRSALDYLFTEDWHPLNVGLILHLHALLFEYADSGGAFKANDNLVVDRAPDGEITVRFRPVSATQTPFYTAELVERYTQALQSGRHHPLLLNGLFALDLLTIHPFTDGNGRVTRALTNALLVDAGYHVGRYVSLEQRIAESADDYYAALLASTHGWHDEAHDPWPWLTYFVTLVADAYDEFEARAATPHAGATKQERVREVVLHQLPSVFRLADIRAALPGVSDQTIRLVLEAMKREHLIESEGTGRGATWGRLPSH